MRRTLLLVFLVLCVGCGPETSTSDVSYLLYRTNRLMKSVKKPSIDICLNGAGKDFASWENNINSVILKWLAPLRPLTAEPLASTVRVAETRSGCDGFVNVAAGTWAHVKEVDGAIVNMNSSGYFASYNVLLHEFGHAFGLRDTYMNKKSGNCMPGQPQSVMCNTSFSELQADDIAGAERVFRRTYPRDSAPPAQPSPSPIADQTAPPPLRTFALPTVPSPQPIGKPFSLTVEATVKEASDGKSYALFAIPTTEGANVASLSMCQGDPTFCGSLGSWSQLKKAGQLAALDVFVVEEPLVLQDGARVTLRHSVEADPTLKVFRLERAPRY